DQVSNTLQIKHQLHARQKLSRPVGSDLRNYRSQPLIEFPVQFVQLFLTTPDHLECRRRAVDESINGVGSRLLRHPAGFQRELDQVRAFRMFLVESNYSSVHNTSGE